MGREEAPLYHAAKRPADAKPTFDERCSYVIETHQGWFSSVGRTTFHWEQKVNRICKLSDTKRRQLIKGCKPPLRDPLVDCVFNAFSYFVSSGMSMFLRHCVLASHSR